MTAEHKLARQPVEIGMMLLMKSRDMYLLMEDHTLTRAIKVCLDSLGNKIGQKLFGQTLVFFWSQTGDLQTNWAPLKSELVVSIAISCFSGGSIQETDCQHQQYNNLYFH